MTGAARLNVFCHENQVHEGPLVHVKIEVSWVLAGHGDENPECRQRCRQRERRNYNVFGRAP
jgi:hypothetical protein